MSKMKKLIATSGFAFCLLTGTNGMAVANILWVPQSGDHLTTVGGYSILEYRNAGLGGDEWDVSGIGTDGGDGPSQLWLFDPPNTASVTFSVQSTAVSFMMSGDNNDGYGEFLVDGNSMGTFDLYNIGDQSLIVSGLTMGNHTISVIQTSQKNIDSSAYNIAIYGGAALQTPVPEPSMTALFGVGMACLGVTRRREEVACWHSDQNS